MISTSPEYDAAVVGNPRKTTATVTFEIIDVTAADDATESATSEASISRIEQTTDNIRQMDGKYCTNEDDYTLLDGSFTLPPASTDGSFQVGWWSNALSQSDKTYAVTQVLTFDFTVDHSSIGITVTFDKGTNEYAEDFTIEAYDSGASLISSVSVTGNTESKYVWEQNLADYRQIVVSITKWGNPFRRARVTEVDFGIVEEYNGDDLISMKVLEELNTTSAEVSANEMQFTVDNQDKRFNILNPTGIEQFLQRKQKITATIGVQKVSGAFENIPMGVYYLTEWKSDAGTLTTTFTAQDILNLLEQSIWRKSDLTTKNLKDLAEEILDDAGIEDYDVDTALSSINVTDYIPIVSHRQALQNVAVAGEAVIYSDRDGKLIIKQLSNTPSGKEIDLDNVYIAPAIKLDKLYNIVDINVYDFIIGGSETAYSGSVDISGTQDVIIEYKEPFTSVSAVVTGGTLNSATYYTNSATLNITASGTVNITATGNKVEIANAVYEQQQTGTPPEELALTLKVDDSLINSTTVAQNVADWILAEADKRKLYNINWRQNPAYETGDIVVVEDEFGENLNTTITKQEFNFAGYLGGITEAKGED